MNGEVEAPTCLTLGESNYTLRRAEIRRPASPGKAGAENLSTSHDLKRSGNPRRRIKLVFCAGRG